ncbi:MAG: glycine cleavage system protein GcvH [Phycisphaerales bacterium JB060]
MPAPDDRRYSDSHEWHKLEGDTVVIGITQFAVDQLTDVTFVEMKPAGTSLSKGDAIGEVESVKTTSDIYAHVDGEIVEVNDALGDNPGLINEDCYGKGWLVKVKASDPSQLDAMMDAGAYAEAGGA